MNDPALKRIRLLTEAHGDPSIHEDGVVVRVWLKDGGEIGTHLTNFAWSLKRPLSDARLEEKFRGQAKVINPAQADEAIRACWTIDELDDTSRLIAPCIPG